MAKAGEFTSENAASRPIERPCRSIVLNRIHSTNPSVISSHTPKSKQVSLPTPSRPTSATSAISSSTSVNINSSAHPINSAPKISPTTSDASAPKKKWQHHQSSATSQPSASSSVSSHQADTSTKIPPTYSTDQPPGNESPVSSQPKESNNYSMHPTPIKAHSGSAIAPYSISCTPPVSAPPKSEYSNCEITTQHSESSMSSAKETNNASSPCTRKHALQSIGI